MKKLGYSEILEVNNQKLTKKYIESLSKQDRENLVEPIFNIFRENGFMYPDESSEDLKKEYKKLLDHQPDLTSMEIYNNSSLATNICRYFCHTFFDAKDKSSKTMKELFFDDVKLKKSIRNRLGMEWLDSDKKGPGVNEAFNLSFKMLIQSFRSQRLVAPVSIFKPDIAKYMSEKYSEPDDLVGDYSCGFGGRLLGCMAAGRRYQGTDPLTVPELNEMANFFNFDKNKYKLIHSGSEVFRGDKDSLDLMWSSPPYYAKKDKEIEYYSSDETQAYNKGEDHFYNVYWKETLNNAKFMLKPNKIFGLNVLDKCTEMINMTKEVFGEPIEIIKLRTVRSHLTKTSGVTKFEPIFIFKNVK